MVIEIEEVAVRTGTTADWGTAKAPILAVGELGIDLTTRQLRIGDGATAFADLPSATPRQVTVVLVAGTKTTADTKIKAGSKIVPVVRTLGTVTTPKALQVPARTAGVSYTITSSDNTDTSTLDVYIWD